MKTNVMPIILVLVMVVIIVAVDLLLFRHRFLGRLVANIIIVLGFIGLALSILKR